MPIIHTTTLVQIVSNKELRSMVLIPNSGSSHTGNQFAEKRSEPTSLIALRDSAKRKYTIPKSATATSMAAIKTIREKETGLFSSLSTCSISWYIASFFNYFLSLRR